MFELNSVDFNTNLTLNIIVFTVSQFNINLNKYSKSSLALSVIQLGLDDTAVFNNQMLSVDVIKHQNHEHTVVAQL